jgi:FlaA1/EpsC-like NDP-sugar epimerase
VNGSGGALGLELCYQILKLGCRKLIILDRYASYLTELVFTLHNYFPREVIVPILVETDNVDMLEKTFRNNRPNVVFHGCMKKYVP